MITITQWQAMGKRKKQLRAARFLRKPTRAEAAVWEVLPIGWKRQPVILGFIPDFVHPATKTIIEVSTFWADPRNTLKDAALRKAGYTVFWVTNREALLYPDQAVQKALGWVKERAC